MAAVVCIVSAVPARALDSRQHLSQYVHSTWRPQDQFLGGQLGSIAQTIDGYLWIGTKTGLLRFDGIRFVPWRSLHGERLPSTEVIRLLAGRDGSLWIGTVAGVSRWKDGRLTTYSSLLVGAIIEARDSTIWFTQGPNSEGGMPLCHVAEERVRCYGAQDGMPLLEVAVPLIEDDRGSLWIGSDTALVRWSSSSHDVYRPPALRSNAHFDGIIALARTSDATLWTGIEKPGTGLGLQRMKDGRWTAMVTSRFDSSMLTVTALMRDDADVLWVGTAGQGMYRIQGNSVEHFGNTDGLSSDAVYAFCKDREGTLWVLTGEGLDSFRDVKVVSLSTREGLSGAEIDSVIASQRGGIWVGEAGALDYVRDGIVSSIRTGKGLPGHQVAAEFEDHTGRLWLGVDNDLFLYTESRFTRIVRPSGVETGLVLGFTEDRDQNVWVEVAGPPRSLLRIHGATVQDEFSAPETPPARRVAADPRGGLWLGLNDGNLAHFDHGTVVTHRFDHDASARVFQLLPFEDGSVLAATSYGVAGRRSGESVLLTARNGLPCDRVFGIVLSGSASLWLYSECGLLEISPQDFHNWWSNPKNTVTVNVFDGFDGARPAQVAFEAAAKSTDGKLWFANGDRIQMLDPTRFERNSAVPPVHIEEIIADQKRYEPIDGLRLPALTRDVEIDYTALSLRVPQRVRFRSRLEGRDSGWQDRGPRRQAMYTDLRPGEYRFSVVASNDDGVWNDVGAQFRFVIAPVWYQTALAKLSALAIIVAVVVAMYLRRVRQLAAAMTAGFDERLLERTRIAQDLHDTFVQTLQGSKLVADDALDPSTDQEHMRHALERLSVWMGQAMLEARTALNSIRESIAQTTDLAEDLRRIANDPVRSPSTSVSFSVSGNLSELHPIVRDEMYAIGSEAIRNALIHSHADQLLVTLSYERDLTLRVHDNGVGIGSGILAGGKDGHFGLQGMRERAVRIGAKLTIHSAIGTGTDVTIVVPGGLAFKNGRPLRPGLFKRRFGDRRHRTKPVVSPNNAVFAERDDP